LVPVSRAVVKAKNGDRVQVSIRRVRSKANRPYHGVLLPLPINAMTTLTITARGQVTFRREVLQHLGLKPGDKIDFELLPEGRALLKAARPSASIDGFVGLLAGRTGKIASIEEINAAAAQGWAGRE
jgi:bifunctional DNA-binding transcriptional regulator/antitoxin component of YhaV-PrlF toxin-antitoxin module